MLEPRRRRRRRPRAAISTLYPCDPPHDLLEVRTGQPDAGLFHTVCQVLRDEPGSEAVRQRGREAERQSGRAAERQRGREADRQRDLR